MNYLCENISFISFNVLNLNLLTVIPTIMKSKIAFLFFIISSFAQIGFSQQIETIHYLDNEIISDFKGGSDVENQQKDNIVRIIVEFNSIPIAGFFASR